MNLRIRGIFKPMIRAIALALARLGITPNLVSLIAALLALLAFYYFYIGKPVTAAAFIFLNGLLDGVDGELARILGGETGFGSFLDAVLDRYSDAAMVLGAAVYLDLYTPEIYFIPPLMLGLLTVLGFIMVSYTRARAEKEGVACDVGLGARSERLLLLVIFTLIDRLFIGLLILCILANLTAFYRIYHAQWRMA